MSCEIGVRSSVYKRCATVSSFGFLVGFEFLNPVLQRIVFGRESWNGRNCCCEFCNFVFQLFIFRSEVFEFFIAEVGLLQFFPFDTEENKGTDSFGVVASYIGLIYIIVIWTISVAAQSRYGANVFKCDFSVGFYFDVFFYHAVVCFSGNGEERGVEVAEAYSFDYGVGKHGCTRHFEIIVGAIGVIGYLKPATALFVLIVGQNIENTFQYRLHTITACYGIG